jgi:predicted transcriptional regulator
MQATITQKQNILNAVQQLPEQTSIDEVMELLFILSKVERGCLEADEGKIFSHQEAEERMKRWLK